MEKRIVREQAKAARKKFYEATRQIDALIVKTEDAVALAKALSPFIKAAELLPAIAAASGAKMTHVILSAARVSLAAEKQIENWEKTPGPNGLPYVKVKNIKLLADAALLDPAAGGCIMVDADDFSIIQRHWAATWQEDAA